MSSLKIYIDEAGVPLLKTPDPNEKFFVLCGVFISDQGYRQCLRMLNDFKSDAIGDSSVILHWIDMRYQRGDFSFLAKQKNRKPFYEKLSRVYKTMPFCTVNIVLNLQELQHKYSNPHHPYHLSLKFIMDRAFLHCMDHNFKRVEIIAESRDPSSNIQLRTEYKKIMQLGTYNRKGEELKTLGFDLEIRDKAENICGLQIADLSASITRRTYLRNDQSRRPPQQYEFIESKFRANRAGNHRGWGLIEFPS